MKSIGDAATQYFQVRNITTLGRVPEQAIGYFSDTWSILPLVGPFIFFAHSSPFPPPGYFPKFLLMQEPWEIADPACLEIGECFLYQEKQIDDEM